MITTIEEALDALDVAEKDTAADHGQDVVDQGGWVDLVRSVGDMCTPEVRALLYARKGLALPGEDN